MEDRRARNNQALLTLVKETGNRRCVDCGLPDPEWASCKLGVFVCLNCSGIHRNLPTPVKSIKLDFWEDEQVEFMKAKSDSNAHSEYEMVVPLYYYRPKAGDHSFLREQWIRAKYERREFTVEVKSSPLPYSTGFYQGQLLKKGKNKAAFLRRMFVLSQKEFTLKYYNKETETKTPKSVINIKDLNVTFQPSKIGHPHGMQLSFPQRNHTRNIYVFHEQAQEAVTWYNAIRAVRYAYLKTVYQTGSPEELIPKITNNYLKEGYMEKNGPNNRELFKKRWFTLDSQNRKLLYYNKPLDPEELGFAFIGTESNGYSVKEHVPKNTLGSKWKHCFAVTTPHRLFVLMCEQKKEMKEWMDAISKVLSRPMAPQDYPIETAVTGKK